MVDIYRGAKGLGYDEINKRGQKAFMPGERIAFREGGGKNASAEDDKRLKRGVIAEVQPSQIVVDVGGKRTVKYSGSSVDIYSQIAVIEEKNFPVGIKGKTIRDTENALMED